MFKSSSQPSPEVEGVNNDYELKLKTDLEYKNKIWFYSSDYSDIL